MVYPRPEPFSIDSYQEIRWGDIFSDVAAVSWIRHGG